MSEPVEAFLLRLEEEQGLTESEKAFLIHLGDLRFHLLGNAREFPVQQTLNDREFTFLATFVMAFLAAFLAELLSEGYGGEGGISNR